MAGQTVILRGTAQRDLAKRLIDAAPIDAVVKIRDGARSKDQNDKMWAMLSDISRARPRGERFTTDQWKARAMDALGWEVQFLPGMDGAEGRFFPYGHKSSNLTVRQMKDLITFLYAFGDQEGVEWSEPNPWEGER